MKQKMKKSEEFKKRWEEIEKRSWEDVMSSASMEFRHLARELIQYLEDIGQ